VNAQSPPKNFLKLVESNKTKEQATPIANEDLQIMQRLELLKKNESSHESSDH
jgi:hypothetical protein